VVVVVDVPDAEGFTAFGCPGARIQELLADEPLVPLDLPVVAERVGRDPLVP
jgi:hypothetical protein